MRNYLIVMVATVFVGISLATAVRAQNIDWRAQVKQLKSQQKLERDALKVRQRNVKQSWKTARVSSATRAQGTHRMQRERRDLIQKQKDELQNLKDRQRASKENQRMSGQ